MDSERTKMLRQHFGDEALLSWYYKYGNAAIYPATATKQIIREWIVAMKYAGLSHKEVAIEMQTSLSHVYNTWKRWLAGRPL